MHQYKYKRLQYPSLILLIMLVVSSFLSYPENNQDSFGRCPNGTHKSPSGDCEKVTDNKGKPRCPDGYHRSPDGDCERVTGETSSNSRNADDDSDKGTPDQGFDSSHSDTDNGNEKSANTNENNDDDDNNEDCPDGSYRNIDGDCTSIIKNVAENDKEITNTEKNSVLNRPTSKNEGIVFEDFDKKNTFYDRSNNLLYMIKGSEEIAVLNDKNLVNKLTVKDIEDPVYDSNKNSIYFLDENNKINVFDGNGINVIDTGIEIDDLEYNPSNGYMYATSSEYGKIFVLDNQELIQTLDTGLGKVEYLAYNPSNGYMYGVDSYFLKDVVVIDGLEIVSKIPLGKSTNVNYLAYNPSNGYMYGVDSYGGKIVVLDSAGIKGNLTTGYKVDFLAYSPSNGYMYAVGNEQKIPETDGNGLDFSTRSNSSASGGLQPFAQIQQFNPDVGNGPLCCKIAGSSSTGSTGNLGFGQSTNGKITIINGTQKIQLT